MITSTPYHRCSPQKQERLRREAVAEVRAGRSLNSIAVALGVSREAVRLWRERAEADPRHGLVAQPPGPKCLLDARQLARLRKVLLQGADRHGFPDPLWTVERVRKVVRRLFGVRYAPGSLRHVLIEHLNFSCQKPEKRASERDEKAIARWKEETFPQAKKKSPAPGTNDRIRR